MLAIFLSQNNETGPIVMSQTNFVGVKLFLGMYTLCFVPTITIVIVIVMVMVIPIAIGIFGRGRFLGFRVDTEGP